MKNSWNYAETFIYLIFPFQDYHKKVFFFLTFYFPYPHGRTCISCVFTTESYKFKSVTFMNMSIYSVKERIQSNQDRDEGEIKKSKMRNVIVSSIYHLKH